MTSKNLCKVLDNHELYKIFGNNQCIRLFKCFLDPELMCTKVEDLSQDQIQLLENKGVLQGLKVEEQIDPIYNLFKEGECFLILLRSL